MSDQSYNEFWGVTEGDCYMDTSGCIASPNYPQLYGYSHVCLIELTDLWEGASIDVIAFHTYDYLYVNDVGYKYWGVGLQGMVPVTTIMWSANQYQTTTGWKICREAAAPVEWANWTCTVLGDDCTRPFNNIYPNTSCSTLYSDPEDEDGDDLLHDGHPWCIAPSSTGQDVNQPCGPCSCLAGEAQTYNSRVLRDNWTSYSYIECTPCLPGTFKSVGGYGAADLCSSCSSGKHTSTHGATACDPCEAGRAAATAGSALCTVCPLGRHAPQEGSIACETCGAGYHSAEEGSSVCEICAAGLHSLANASACEACDPGHSSTAGTDSCEACAPGRFSGTVSADSCLPCESGRYSANASSTRCTDCDIGRFADVSGMSRCYLCYDVLSPSGANPHLWTTMREAMWNGEFVLMSVDGADKLDDCGCDEGAWMSLDSQCYECGEGMLCNGLGKVILMEGYFAPSDNAGDVWKCHGIEERCPGGAPGTGAKNRLNTSLACGECEVGTRATTSGECDKCGSGELGLFVLVALAFLVCLCVVYYMTATENRAKQKESIALIAIMASQIVTAV